MANPPLPITFSNGLALARRQQPHSLWNLLIHTRGLASRAFNRQTARSLELPRLQLLFQLGLETKVLQLAAEVAFIGRHVEVAMAAEVKQDDAFLAGFFGL